MVTDVAVASIGRAADLDGCVRLSLRLGSRSQRLLVRFSLRRGYKHVLLVTCFLFIFRLVYCFYVKLLSSTNPKSLGDSVKFSPTEIFNLRF